MTPNLCDKIKLTKILCKIKTLLWRKKNYDNTKLVNKTNKKCEEEKICKFFVCDRKNNLQTKLWQKKNLSTKFVWIIFVLSALKIQKYIFF